MADSTSAPFDESNPDHCEQRNVVDRVVTLQLNENESRRSHEQNCESRRSHEHQNNSYDNDGRRVFQQGHVNYRRRNWRGRGGRGGGYRRGRGQWRDRPSYENHRRNADYDNNDDCHVGNYRLHSHRQDGHYQRVKYTERNPYHPYDNDFSTDVPSASKLDDEIDSYRADEMSEEIDEDANQNNWLAVHHHSGMDDILEDVVKAINDRDPSLLRKSLNDAWVLYENDETLFSLSDHFYRHVMRTVWEGGLLVVIEEMFVFRLGKWKVLLVELMRMTRCDLERKKKLFDVFLNFAGVNCAGVNDLDWFKSKELFEEIFHHDALFLHLLDVYNERGYRFPNVHLDCSDKSVEFIGVCKTKVKTLRLTMSLNGDD